MSEEVEIIPEDRSYYCMCKCGCGRYLEFVGNLRTGIRIVGSNEKELNMKSVKYDPEEWTGKLRGPEARGDLHYTFACDCGECDMELEFVGDLLSDIVFITDRETKLDYTSQPVVKKKWKRYLDIL